MINRSTDGKTRVLKALDGYDGQYLVSNFGEIYSVASGKFLKPDVARGYLQVTLYRHGERHREKVHRLVAKTFIDNPLNLPQVNHKDENKQNNFADNLEWCDAKYNTNYGLRGQHSRETQIKNAKYRASVKPVLCVDTGEIFATTKEAERTTGAYHSHISRCCNGKEQTAGGLSWRWYFD